MRLLARLWLVLAPRSAWARRVVEEDRLARSADRSAPEPDDEMRERVARKLFGDD